MLFANEILVTHVDADRDGFSIVDPDDTSTLADLIAYSRDCDGRLAAYPLPSGYGPWHTVVSLYEATFEGPKVVARLFADADANTVRAALRGAN